MGRGREDDTAGNARADAGTAPGTTTDFRWRAIKSALILTAFASAYAALLFLPLPLSLRIVLTACLSLLTYAIVACIGHDAVHGVFARARRVNELALLALDFAGVNGQIWRERHMQHHRETNHVALDPDIRGMPWLRMTPHDQWLPHHRLQAFFAPLVYALTILKVQLFDEIGFIAEAPKRRRLAMIARSALGKIVFVCWAIALPIWLHGPSAIPLVVFGYCTLSLIVSVIFQVAHNMPGVTHLDARRADRGHSAWQRDQVATTTNFRVGRVLGFFVGGLDRQIEHHLFPQLPHTQLAAKGAIAREIARSLDVDYRMERSLFHASWSHLRYLHTLGRKAAR